MDRFGRILVASDFSGQSRWALAEALRLKRDYGAQLHVLHVEVTRSVAGLGYAPLPGPVASLLDDLQREIAGSHADTVVHVRRAANAVDGILEYAAEQRIDLIVLGTRGLEALPELLLGSVAQDVVRRAPVPVLVVAAAPANVDGPVMTLLDFGAPTPEILLEAAALAVDRGVPLVVVHAVDTRRVPHGVVAPEERASDSLERLDCYVHAYLPSKLPVAVQTVVASGRAADVILEAAAKHRAGLIVMGPSTHTATQRMLRGSVSKPVTRLAPCPVLVCSPRPRQAADEAAAAA